MSSAPNSVFEREAPTEKKRAVRTLLDDLVRRYYGPLGSFFRKRIHNAPEVQDLVQQVFLRLAQYGELGELHNPDAYIFQTAANTLRDHYRHRAVRDRFANEQCTGTGALGSDFSAERVILGREAVAQLAQALRQLPERTRDILMLRCFEGIKHAEIARLQGISVRAVEKHVAKALAYLSGALERDRPE
jgi:RNA polymerase sigma-70 factor (ECF subfamily)